MGGMAALAPSMASLAYRRLKAALLANAYPAGERLDLAELARAHAVSVTPIREAVVRLSGEGLVVAHARGGYAVPRLTAGDLIHLLALHRDLLILAVNGADTATLMASAQDEVGEPGEAGPDAAVFAAIAALSRNSLLRALIAQLGDRLAPFRIAEARILPGCGADRFRLEGRLAAGDLTGLKAAIRSYHRRRMTVADQLLWTTATNARRDTP